MQATCVRFCLTSELCIRSDLKDKNFEVVSVDQVGVVGLQLLYLGSLSLHLFTNLQKQQLEITWGVTGELSLVVSPTTHLLHGDREFAALVQQFADSVGRVAVTLWQFGHISLDPSDHTFHLHLMHLKEEPHPQSQTQHCLRHNFCWLSLPRMVFLCGIIQIHNYMPDMQANKKICLVFQNCISFSICDMKKTLNCFSFPSHRERVWDSKLKRLAASYNMLLMFSYKKLIFPV